MLPLLNGTSAHYLQSTVPFNKGSTLFPDGKLETLVQLPYFTDKQTQNLNHYIELIFLKSIEGKHSSLKMYGKRYISDSSNHKHRILDSPFVDGEFISSNCYFRSG